MFQCLDQFDLLLQSGGKLDEVDQDHQTPFHIAAQVGCSEIVDRLLELGANAEQYGDYGSPIDLAAARGNVGIIAKLLNHGGPSLTRNVQRAALHFMKPRDLAALKQLNFYCGAGQMWTQWISIAIELLRSLRRHYQKVVRWPIF